VRPNVRVGIGAAARLFKETAAEVAMKLRREIMRTFSHYRR